MAAASLVGESVVIPRRLPRKCRRGAVAPRRHAPRRRRTHRLFVHSCRLRRPRKAADRGNGSDNPTNSYGATKLAFEHALASYAGAYGLSSVSLRYFNAAGATDTRGERHDPETHLIPLVLEVAAGARQELLIFGDDYSTPDGTCVRDYIHVEDLADAHSWR